MRDVYGTGDVQKFEPRLSRFVVGAYHMISISNGHEIEPQNLSALSRDFRASWVVRAHHITRSPFQTATFKIEHKLSREFGSCSWCSSHDPYFGCL